jgi:Gram-negative bacterial TonB protein C-terminal
VLEAEALMNIGPLIRSSEELLSSLAVEKDFDGMGEDCAQLLELRTQSGPVYVCPSRWQRFRLRWAFRHFHVLPPQVLSRRDQRLIESLARSAVVAPSLPVDRERIIGVVENVRPQTMPRQVLQLRPERARPRAFQAKPQISGLLRLGLPERKRLFAVGSLHKNGSAAANREARFVRDARFRQWGALGTLVAVCTVVILLRFSVPSLFPGATPLSNPPTASAPAERAAIVKPRVIPPLIAASPTVLLPFIPRHRLAPPAPEPALAAEESSSPVSVLAPSGPGSGSVAPPVESAAVAFVSELPQGHFAEPIVHDPSLVGELRLRALIGSDGSVKEVTVVSGSPKLAEVGVPAVRQWRYQALGHAGEAETLIRMSFFGQDGVSVASIAK